MFDVQQSGTSDEGLERLAKSQAASRLGDEGIPEQLSVQQLASELGLPGAFAGGESSEQFASRELQECLMRNNLAAALWWTERLLSSRDDGRLSGLRASLLFNLEDSRGIDAFRVLKQTSPAWHKLYLSSALDSFLWFIESLIDSDSSVSEENNKEALQRLDTVALLVEQLDAEDLSGLLTVETRNPWTRWAALLPRHKQFHEAEPVLARLAKLLRQLKVPPDRRAVLSLRTAFAWSWSAGDEVGNHTSEQRQFARQALARLLACVTETPDVSTDTLRGLALDPAGRANTLELTQSATNLEMAMEPRLLADELSRRAVASNVSNK